jgi:hypothetical protein
MIFRRDTKMTDWISVSEKMPRPHHVVHAVMYDYRANGFMCVFEGFCEDNGEWRAVAPFSGRVPGTVISWQPYTEYVARILSSGSGVPLPKMPQVDWDTRDYSV